MDDVQVLEPAIDPNNRISFLLDWELTMKCNLDCSYCATGLYGGHDNSISHPPLDECLQSIDFMFQYVDLYMKHKPKGIRYCIINVYGGESLHHPDIVEILQNIRAKHQMYQDRWHLTVTTTTNLIVNDKKLDAIIPYVDEFTVSYHSEINEKQKNQFKQNIKKIKESDKRVKCVVMMHHSQEMFDDANKLLDWLDLYDISYLPKKLDKRTEHDRYDYNQSQITWFDTYYNKKSQTKNTTVGRSCCGGRQLCKNNDRSQRYFSVHNRFPDWFCSVNEFFLFVKQVTGEIFVNKDCKMNFSGEIKPIGHLGQSKTLLEWTEKNLSENTMPVIQCKRSNCLCGLCAPKAKDLDVFKKIMEKYQR